MYCKRDPTRVDVIEFSYSEGSYDKLSALEKLSKSRSGSLKGEPSITVEIEIGGEQLTAVPVSIGGLLPTVGVTVSALSATAEVEVLVFRLVSLKSPIEASIREPMRSLSRVRAFSVPISLFCFFLGGDLADVFLTDFLDLGALLGDFVPFGDFAVLGRPFFPVSLSEKEIYECGIKRQ